MRKASLKQIGLAVHNYESAVQKLPPSMNSRGNTTLVFLLPYLEQDNRYRMWEPTFTQPGATWWGSPALPVLPGLGTLKPGESFANEGEIGLFRCPSDASTASIMVGIGLKGIPGKHYPSGGIWPPAGGANSGLNLNWLGFFSYDGLGELINKTGKTNYVVNIGFVANDNAGLDQYLGAFRYNNRALAVTGITDGTSNTIGFLESTGGFSRFSDVPAASGWTAYSYSHAYSSSLFGTCPGGRFCDSSSEGLGKGFGRFSIPSSFHSGNRINTLMMDGSVRSFASSINFLVYASLCGAQDGDVVNFD